MENFTRFEIIGEDRMGIAVEILQKVYEAKINLVSVEVFPGKVLIKIQYIDECKKKSLKENICKIKGIINISEIELLYYEENERRLLAVINSVDEGIISIDKNFKIGIFNDYCEKVFHYKKEEVLETDVRSLIGDNAPIIKLITNGDEYDNVEFSIKNERGKSHYITSGRAIKDDDNKTVGAVASIKDMNEAMELADVITSTKEGAFKEIVGNSISIERVKKLISTIAKSNSTVLLRGESGTGKELFAKAIKNLSDRRNNSFVTINCAALPDNLIESELFGYEKGSFTGAINSGKEGLFKEADGGTLFLDEIGELSMILQAKILRVIQEGVIRKIGSNKEEKVDVRIIAATNRNLEEMIEKQQFREDLYYRLNVIPVYIPVLKDRLEDIPILVRFFIDKLNKKVNKKIKGADIEFINRLMKYDWPGNVRELQNFIERAMNLCEGNYLTLESLNMDFKDSKQNIVTSLCMENELKLSEIVELCERQAISKVLEKTKSFRKAAKILGVSHTTIINKVNKYNIICKN
ncbi:sigma 54-interacting transcriptional regulator [Clostridiaceae bacterium UIB06]|uniref:HTH-type transcriptional regulatory protein TyrR n=1 Tax=Clostridium thailandense TaxID=2794346 RepID=A0A949TUW2_9CLOT|nr:sigma 54-interacting transcriptional regulator [Clostridium thailandense]MBV7273926.1 sigma 54-interacting transcriptional regulator [Clostridium thailandense]MCH5137208.1 sigma 54-interacting transcriptional regulator [Clostridiaceae bacterium UIB06]